MGSDLAGFMLDLTLRHYRQHEAKRRARIEPEFKASKYGHEAISSIVLPMFHAL